MTLWMKIPSKTRRSHAALRKKTISQPSRPFFKYHFFSRPLSKSKGLKLYRGFINKIFEYSIVANTFYVRNSKFFFLRPVWAFRLSYSRPVQWRGRIQMFFCSAQFWCGWAGRVYNCYQVVWFRICNIWIIKGGFKVEFLSKFIVVLIEFTSRSLRWSGRPWNGICGRGAVALCPHLIFNRYLVSLSTV